ncbi:MAG: hypothetical protein H8E84_00565 [Flavobacteriales bacterium]|nr:hypothetical protein [Flavobacteriales bacterium]
MEQTRFIELKNEMHLIRQKDMQLSARVDAVSDDSDLEYNEVSYKKLHATDLPIYRKWICGDSYYFYRGRIVEGRVVCDKLVIENHIISYTTTYLSSVMAASNEESNAEEFADAISKLLKYLVK